MLVDIEANEATFQEAMQQWESTLEEKYSAIMFDCIYKACTNIALSIYRNRGFNVAGTDLVYNKAIDATLICMRNILYREHRPEKLSSYCYLRVKSEINRIDNKEEKFKEAILKAKPSSNIFEEDIADKLYGREEDNQ